MTKLSINSLNWTFCQRINGPLRAIIHLGAYPIENNELNIEIKEFYLVNILEEDDRAISQNEFCSLEQALAFMELQYGHWEFQNQLSDLESKGGCSSCAAH